MTLDEGDEIVVTGDGERDGELPGRPAVVGQVPSRATS